MCGYTDPHEALAVARINPDQFDLVVTDHNMPGMSGLDVVHANCVPKFLPPAYAN